jgi:hypothetical protein
VQFAGAGMAQPMQARVTASEYRRVLNGENNDPVYPAGIFVVVLVDVTNNGTRSDYVGGRSLRVQDSAGRQFDMAELEAQWAAQDEFNREGVYDDIQPGFTRPLVFAFDVLETSTDLHLIPGD